MTEPRVDFKIGVDFEDLDAQLGGKAQQLGAQFQAELAGKAAPAAQKVTDALQQAGAATDTAREKLRDYGAAGSVLTGIWAAWNLVSGAVQAITARTIEVGRALLDAQVFAERFAITMKLATGGDAGTQMDYVRGVVNRLGLELQSTANYYALFQAASRGTALEGDNARRVFEAVASASAVMGLSAWDAEGVFRALTQMISKGTVQAEEMRGQLGERLPGAFQIAARALGVTTGEFSKMLDRGEVIATQFLPAFARQLQEEFGGSVELASRRTEASLNRLSTAWLDLKTAVSQSGVGGFLAGQINILADAFNDIGGSIRGAREQGLGFVAQLHEGVFALARFLNPLNAFSYSAQDAGAKLAAAKERLAEVRAALADNTNPVLLQERNDLQALIAQLEAARNKALDLRTFLSTSPARIEAAIDAERIDKQQRAMTALQQTMQAVAGVSDEYDKGMQRVNAALAAGAIDASAAARMQALLAGKYTESGKAAAAAAEASARYKRELVDKIGALQDSVAASDKLTKGEKLLADLERDLASGKAKLSKAEADATRARLAGVIATEKQNEASKALMKTLDDYDKARAKGIETAQKALDQIQQEIQKQQDHNATIGMSALQLAEYNRQKTLNQAASKEQYAELLTLAGGEESLAKIYRDQAAALRELASGKYQGALADANRKAAEDSAKEWQKTAEQIEQSLTDALVRGFESGKGFFRSIGDYIVNYFRTTVARGIAQSLLGAAGLGASGTALAGGLGGAAGGAGSSFLGSALGGVAGFGGAFGAGIFGGLGTVGLTSGVGLGGTLSAAGSLIGTGSPAGVISGIGMGLGAVAPYALAAYGLYKLFTGGGETRYGAQYGMRGGEVYKLEGPSGGDPNAEATMRSIAAAADTMRAAIGAFGGSYVPGISRAGYEFSQESGHRFSEIFVNGVGRRLYGQGSNEEVTAAFATDLQRAVLLGLQQSDLSKPFAEYFRSIDAFALDTAQIDAVLQAANAAQSMAQQTAALGGVFTQLGDLSVEARGNILGLVGGLDQFVAKVSGYVGSFYSQSEQAAISASTIASTLQAAGVDITGLDTKAEFRSIVDSLNLSTTSGQEQLAALLNVSQQFASLTDYLAENNITLQQLADQAPQIAVLQSIAGKSDQQTSAIKDGFMGLGNAIDAVGSIVASTWGSAAAAISSLADRPVSVTITVPTQEVGVLR